MAKQQLIYETVVPVSAARHGDCFVEIGGRYDFSGKVNSVPLMAVEFPYAASEYAIVFAGSGGNLMPAVILGVRGNENLFLSKERGWEAKYVPAFIRRYPFVFSTSPDGKQLILCIDEAYEGFNREGRGQRLFDESGKPTPYVDNVLKFLQEYQAQFRRTQAFCAKVKDLDILQSMQAQVQRASGSRLSLGGFMAVDRPKLKALPGEKLAALAPTDELELLYLHLQSMRNFLGLRDRLAAADGEDESAGAGTGAGEEPSAAPAELHPSSGEMNELWRSSDDRRVPEESHAPLS
jgi:SapC